MAGPVVITLGQVDQLAPDALPVYRTALGAEQHFLEHFGIAASALRVSHFMAQVLHESAALSRTVENLRYSAQRLPQVWPQRFRPRGPLDPASFANDDVRLANEVYGGRLGNDRPGDGYRYRGRGLLQLTGKDSYAQATDALQAGYPLAPDFVAEPDAVISARWCLGAAAAIWVAKDCNEAADEDDIVLVTTRINGGTVGLAERRRWLARTRAMWGGTA
ncbi:glycoside hydrolase family 19 protein [Massilia atriviolacea]|uniref:Glycoside hydrolase family 19 protein n=1 Tax=Massilia atriviolacea TaxID=2495579 RepID=A0A430HQK2_9BURK|nr:glycoside hydrolase family 19 protein [Massilia atriviolacea]RSZ59790.1 glycoside hydrolase family 19 protein [Massilia atriviolacea]